MYDQVLRQKAIEVLQRNAFLIFNRPIPFFVFGKYMPALTYRLETRYLETGFLEKYKALSFYVYQKRE